MQANCAMEGVLFCKDANDLVRAVPYGQAGNLRALKEAALPNDANAVPDEHRPAARHDQVGLDPASISCSQHGREVQGGAERASLTTRTCSFRSEII